MMQSVFNKGARMGRRCDKGGLLDRQAKDTTRLRDRSKDNFRGRILANKNPHKRLSGGIIKKNVTLKRSSDTTNSKWRSL